MDSTIMSSTIVNRVKKKKKKVPVLFIILLLAYPILQWAVFWLYPNIRTLILPFQRWDKKHDPASYVFLGKDKLFYNFQRQIESFIEPDFDGSRSLMFKAFFNTFHSLAINLILLPLATIIGYALAKHVPGEKFFRILFFSPNIISMVVLCVVFRTMFEVKEKILIGPAAKILLGMGINFTGWSFENTKQVWTLIYAYCIWAGLSINVVLISSAFQRIPKDITESARLDGVTFLQDFAKISVPLIMPTISTFLINSFIAVTAFYMQPYLLLNFEGLDKRYATIPWFVFSVSQGGNQAQYIAVATVGILFTAIMFPLIVLARFIGKKLTPDVEF